MTHLTLEKFRDALDKGLGRAVIQVREQGQDNLGDDILNACLASCCLWVYEHTPCSLCRESAVKALLERERAPKTLLLECLWDCSKDIRAMAKSRN